MIAPINNLKLNCNTTAALASKKSYAVLNVRTENPCISFGLNNDVFIKQKTPVSTKSPNDISFGYNFELKKPRRLHCAYCGKEMVSQDEVKYFCSLKGSDFKCELERLVNENRSKFSPINIEAVRLLEKVAMDNPDKTGDEILPMAYTRSRNRMIYKQASVLDKVENLSQELRSKKITAYIRKVKDQDIALDPNISVEDLSEFLENKTNIEYRKKVINTVKLLASKYRGTKKESKIAQNIISQISELPSSKTDADAYLVKFISGALRKDPKINTELFEPNDKESYKFYAQLLSPLLSSAEHIDVHSGGGASHYSNYLVTHTYCNSKRSNMPWSKFMLNNPKRFDFVSANLRQIAEDNSIAASVQNFEIPEYIQAVSQTLNSQLRNELGHCEVVKFTKEVADICKSSLRCKPFRIYTEPSKSSVISKKNLKEYVDKQINNILTDNTPDKYNEAFEKSYRQTFSAIVEARRSIYANLISDFTQRGFRDFSRTLYRFKKQDPVIILKLADDNAVKNAFDEEKWLPYIKSMEQIIKNNYTYNFTDTYLNKKIRKLPNILSPLRKPNTFYFKALADSRISKGVYDIEKLKNYTDNSPLFREDVYLDENAAY